MRVVLEYYRIEELAWCEKENGEWYPVAEDTELELSVDEVEFDRDDLEEIVERYKDEVIDILLRDHYDDLVRAFKKRKARQIDGSSKNDSKDAKNSTRQSDVGHSKDSLLCGKESVPLGGYSGGGEI